MKNILLLTSFLISITAIGQSNFEKLILGTWELQERIDNNPLESMDIFGSGSDNAENQDPEHDEMFFFQKNETVDVLKLGEQHQYSYQISGSTLQLGNITYNIKRLTKDSLILNRKEMLIDEDLILTNSERKISPLQKEQKIQTKYPSGQLKLLGQEVNGFQHGIWTEWYESGSVKRVTHYQMDVIFMRIEFDQKGKIISRAWYDLEAKKMKSDPVNANAPLH